MIHAFDNNITLLSRDYKPQQNSLAIVIIGDTEVTVPDHPFWMKFAQGWEPDTQRIYQSSVKAGSTVLDIGAWIGPTVLFSLACGADKIVALEPNPISFSSLKQIIDLNPQLGDKIAVLNQAVGNKSGTLKMGLAEGESDTSTFGIQGNEIEIETTTIDALIKSTDLENIDLIKIDIEGAEVLLRDDLKRLSQNPAQKIHLSIHVPFFPASTDKGLFAQAFKNFTIIDDRGEQISYQILEHRLLTEQTHPDWGTKHGNFFEIFLIAG